MMMMAWQGSRRPLLIVCSEQDGCVYTLTITVQLMTTLPDKRQLSPNKIYRYNYGILTQGPFTWMTTVYMQNNIPGSK